MTLREYLKELKIDQIERLDFSISQECDNVYDIGKYSPCV